MNRKSSYLLLSQACAIKENLKLATLIAVQLRELLVVLLLGFWTGSRAETGRRECDGLSPHLSLISCDLC